MTEIKHDQVLNALSGVYDPEINIPITDLGLIYRINIEGEHLVVDFSLTSPGCPLADYLENEIRRSLERVEGVEHLAVNLVWTPLWGPELMNDEARLTLGYSI
ncbi:MAG: metal-sulfur cluster assembly factor [Spirochaetales bacterium]|nr:metal-sulfur cluster assembly factor [Spirochaetales bacterium]